MITAYGCIQLHVRNSHNFLLINMCLLVENLELKTPLNHDSFISFPYLLIGSLCILLPFPRHFKGSAWDTDRMAAGTELAARAKFIWTVTTTALHCLSLVSGLFLLPLPHQGALILDNFLCTCLTSNKKLVGQSMMKKHVHSWRYNRVHL